MPGDAACECSVSPAYIALCVTRWSYGTVQQTKAFHHPEFSNSSAQWGARLLGSVCRSDRIPKPGLGYAARSDFQDERDGRDGTCRALFPCPWMLRACSNASCWSARRLVDCSARPEGCRRRLSRAGFAGPPLGSAKRSTVCEIGHARRPASSKLTRVLLRARRAAAAQRRRILLHRPKARSRGSRVGGGVRCRPRAPCAPAPAKPATTGNHNHAVL